MPKTSNKSDLLNSGGYSYNFDRMMYINRRHKKAFSVEFVDDNPESKIAESIRETNKDGDWHFYTSGKLSEGVERELKRVLQ